MRNIIFDFGNVLVMWEPERLYREYFGDEAEAAFFMKHVATAEWRTSMDAGRTFDDAVSALKKEWPQYEEAIGLWQHRWFDMLTGEVEGMRELLMQLKAMPDVHLYGLTNWSMETLPQTRDRFPVMQLIEDYVASGAEGLTKPDERLFRRLLERYHLAPQECLFIDDNEVNVKAARRLGMKGICFTSASDLRWQLGLYHAATPDEVATLQAQGCSSDSWHSLFIADGTTTLPQLRNASFEGGNYLGYDAVVRHAVLRDCHLEDHSRVERAGLVSNYRIGQYAAVEGVGELSFSHNAVWAEVMNENGGRRIAVRQGVEPSVAYLWARYRDRAPLLGRLESMVAQSESRGLLAAHSTLHGATAVVDSLIGPRCYVGYGVIAERVITGEQVHLDRGLRVADTVVGDCSTLERCEVTNSFIFPAHQQHHNSSFLIAALTLGQSNIASGATLGSNHNGRTADGELQCGRGFWPGLCVSVKHFSRFASYTLLDKGDYPSELNITLPFSLVNNNVAKNRLEVMPAYWWRYNMYALNRNITKFATRDERLLRRQHIVYNPFAPDTAEELLMGRDLLRTWTTQSYSEGQPVEVIAHGMERGHRKTLILAPGEGYRAYEEMLIYYAMQSLRSRPTDECQPRVQRWVNIGGQLLRGADADCLLADIESGRIGSLAAVQQRLDDLWALYPQHREDHAYALLCHLAQKHSLTAADWQHYEARYQQLQLLVRDRIAASRQKDTDNEYRQTTFFNTAELKAVMEG